MESYAEESSPDEAKKYTFHVSLMEDIARGNLEMVQKKVKQDIYDPDFRDEDQRTPIHIAPEKGRAKILEVLCKNGCNIYVRDFWNHYPEHLAPDRETRSVLIQSCNAQVNLNDPFNRGDLEVILAASKGNKKDLRKILGRSKTAANYKDFDLRTPLHFAVKGHHSNHPEVVRMLIKAGADIRAKDKEGHDPIHDADQARKDGSLKGKEIYDILLNHKKQIEPPRNICDLQ